MGSPLQDNIAQVPSLLLESTYCSPNECPHQRSLDSAPPSASCLTPAPEAQSGMQQRCQLPGRAVPQALRRSMKGPCGLSAELTALRLGTLPVATLQPEAASFQQKSLPSYAAPSLPAYQGPRET